MSFSSLPANLVAEIASYLGFSDRCSMFIALPSFANKIEVAITFNHIELWKKSDQGVQIGTAHVLERMAQIPDSAACTKSLDLRRFCSHKGAFDSKPPRRLGQWPNVTPNTIRNLHAANSWWCREFWPTDDELKTELEGDRDCCTLIPFILTAVPNLESLAIRSTSKALIERNFKRFLSILCEHPPPANQMSKLKSLDIEAAGRDDDLDILRALLNIPSLARISIDGSDDDQNTFLRLVSSVEELVLKDANLSAVALGMFLRVMPALKRLKYHSRRCGGLKYLAERENLWLHILFTHCHRHLEFLSIDDNHHPSMGITAPDFRGFSRLTVFIAPLALFLDDHNTVLSFVLPQSLEHLTLLRQADERRRWPAIARLFDGFTLERDARQPSLADITINNTTIITFVEELRWRWLENSDLVVLGEGFTQTERSVAMTWEVIGGRVYG